MKYEQTKPPDWLKHLPAGAVRIGVDVFNRVTQDGKPEEHARRAAMDAIRAQFEEGPDGTWKVRQDVRGRERAETLHFRAAQADETGLVWEAVLIAPGLSLSWPRFYWTDEVLEPAAELFTGVDICAYELTADFFSHLKLPNVDLMEDVKRYLTSRKVGWIEKAWFEPGVGIKGTINFLAEHAQIPAIIKDGQSKGNDEALGLSIDSRVKGFEVDVNGDTVIWPTAIVSASSVDVVTHPAAGGRFLRAVAGLDKQREDLMNREELLAMIEGARPDLLKGKDRAAMSEEEVIAMARMAMTPVEKPAGADVGAGAAGAAAGEHHAAQDTSGIPGALTLAQVQAAIADAMKPIETRAACERMLDTALAGDGLPEHTKPRIRAMFAGRSFGQADLDKAIKDEKEYLASMNVPGFDLVVGDQGRASMGMGTLEKLQAATDRLFGLKKDDMLAMARMERLDHRPFFDDMRAAQDYADFDQVPAFHGLREMYVHFSGDPEIRGTFDRRALPADLRAAQDITSSTFTYALGNTLGRRLVMDYREVDFQENLLISTRKPVKDFRSQEAVNLGYYGDIDDVDPETEDYQEIAGTTDEESTYSVGTKGNLLTLTRRVIMNDDVALQMKKVKRVGRAIRRTHAQYVWNFFLNNSTCSDETAWFTEAHGNLITSALALATAIAAYKALAGMTEKDSGKPIGLLADPGVKPVLVYPTALMETGEQCVEDEFYYASNDLTTKTRNPLKGKIKGAMIDLFTDDTDWGMLMPPDVVDMIEMGYINGNQEPEVFVADSPQSEQMFVGDKIRHKFRHEYGGAVVDFVSGYKGVVAG